MFDNMLHTGLLLAGFLGHAVMRTYEEDKKTPTHDVSFLDVVWHGAERWRTMLMVGLLLVIGLTGSSTAALTAMGVTVTEVSGLAILLLGVGYNIDSLSKKLFAVGSKA